MPKLSVKLNDVFGDDVPYEQMIASAAEAGADGIGFWPWFDDELDVVVEAAANHGVDVAYLSGGSEFTDGPEFPLADPSSAEDAVEEIIQAIDIAARADADFLNIIPGWKDETIDSAVQHMTIVRSFRELAPVAEESDVTLLVEPINARVDLPGIYLTSSYEGYKIVDAVDSPNVRLLYDVYHQQITEGNIVSNIGEHVDAIGHIHVADVPGRHEPGTGEIDYPFVIDALVNAGYDGYIGCEFHPLGDPVDAIKHVRTLLDSAV